MLALVDIDELKRSEQTIAAARDYAANTIETVRESLVVLDGQLRVESANRLPFNRSTVLIVNQEVEFQKDQLVRILDRYMGCYIEKRELCGPAAMSADRSGMRRR